MVGSYPVARFLVGLLYRKWLGACTGAENVPKGGAIFCANHSSYLDHLFVGYYFAKHFHKVPRSLAKKEHFSDPLQWLWHTYVGAIPLDREAGGQEALEKAASLLRKGEWIMMYPEGTRTLTGKLNRAKTGAVRLAIQARVPVIPMGITNTFYTQPKGRMLPRGKRKSDLNIGKPMEFTSRKQPTKAQLRAATNSLMREIAKLAKTEYPFEDE